MKDRRLELWVCLAVMALLLFGNSGFRSLLSGWQEKRRLSRTVDELRGEHETLARELARIQQDPAYTEFLIRKTLGYVEKGEVEYRLMPKSGSSRSARPAGGASGPG